MLLALTTRFSQLLKQLSGKNNGVIYLRIYDAGLNAEMKDSVGKEYTLQELNQMGAEKSPDSEMNKKFY